MSARDDLARVIEGQIGAALWASLNDPTELLQRTVDAVLSEWLPTLADDDVLVQRLAAPKRPPVQDAWLTQRITEGVQHDLRALARALTPPP